MLDLAHLRDEIGELDEFGMRGAPRPNHMDSLGPRRQRRRHFPRIQHFIADHVIDLIKDYEIIPPAVNLFAAKFPGLLAEADVLGIGFRAANFHEAAAHGPNFEFVVAQHLRGVELAVVPRAFYELHHKDPQPLSDGAKPGAKRAGGFAFAGAGVDDQLTFTFGHRIWPGFWFDRSVKSLSKRSSLGVQFCLD